MVCFHTGLQLVRLHLLLKLKEIHVVTGYEYSTANTTALKAGEVEGTVNCYGEATHS